MVERVAFIVDLKWVEVQAGLQSGLISGKKNSVLDLRPVNEPFKQVYLIVRSDPNSKFTNRKLCGWFKK
jgi:hypothetical protein